MKRLSVRILGLAILGVCLLFFGRMLAVNFQQLPPLVPSTRLVAMLAAVVALVLFVYLLQILIVHLLLRGLGETPELGELAPIILLSQFAKYLPGNVGHYVGRVALGRKYGYGSQHLVFTVGYEIGWVIVVAMAIAVLTLLHSGQTVFAGRLPALPSAWLIASALAAMLALPPLGTLLLSRWRPPLVVRLLGSATVSLPPMGTTAACMLLLLLSFIANGLGLALLAEGMIGSGLDRLVFIVGVFSVAWLAGFVVPGAPGGLGIREAILVAGLSPAFGEPAALALTIGSRLCFIVGDGLAFLFGLVAYRLRPPNLQSPDST